MSTSRLRWGRDGAVAIFLHAAGGNAFREPLGVRLGLGGGPQVDGEGPDIGGEDEGDDPFQVGGDGPIVGSHIDEEGNGEAELDEDERELDPEGSAEDAKAAIL